MNLIEITDKFTGGNVKVIKREGDTFFIEPDLRDSDTWFYWAFCVKGANGKTLTFDFGTQNWIGHFGPAISHNLKEWNWLNDKNGYNSFTYTFKDDEDCVYFAHHQLYHPDRFYELGKNKGIDIKTLCTSEKGNDVPYFEYGNGDKIIFLTARHHACESTGNYVMEGIIDSFVDDMIDGYKIVGVPFVDFDGVIYGDQGKARAPHDHNRDYSEDAPIYSSVARIKEYLSANNILFAFDLHSPWHISGLNDLIFVVQKKENLVEKYNKFAEYLEESMTEEAYRFKKENYIAPNTEWNTMGGPCFCNFSTSLPTVDLSFTLETAYFGTEDNVFSQEGAVELGRCFAKAIRKYIAQMN